MKLIIFQLVAALLIGISALSGQSLYSRELQDLSVPPLDRVVDFGEIFSVDGASRSELSQRLNALNERYQFSVYYIAYSGIIGSNVGEKAAEFRDRWLGAEEEGLIFVCDTDMKMIAYAFTKVNSFPLDGSQPTWKLPDREVAQAMMELTKINATQMSEEEYLSTMGQRLVDELESRLKPNSDSKKKGVGGVIGAVTLAAGLVGIGVWWIRRKSGAMEQEMEGTLFPRIEIPNRLGAHFGGGTVCEISFQPSSSPSDS